MDFALTETQERFKQEVIEFAQSELNSNLVERDQQSEFSMEDWQKCAEFGIQALGLPASYTGRKETDFLTAMLAMEGLGYGCRDNGLAFALNAQMWTVQLPILRFGTEEQKQKYLPPMAQGRFIGAHVITEPATGSDVFSMETRALRVEGGYLLNGIKHYITLGPIADVSLVFAVTDPESGKWGVSAFIVDNHQNGITRGENQAKLGLRTVPFGEIRFKDCLIPEDSLLGVEGAGVSLSTSSLEWERCCILASQLGAMQRQLEETVEFARTRRQFGKSIGKFQSVSNRVVEMKLRLEVSRLLLHKVAWLKQTGQPAMLDAALLKLYLSESFVASSMDAIGIHGGKGFIVENEIERDLRDAIGGTIYAGTSDIQRNIVATLLGL